MPKFAPGAQHDFLVLVFAFIFACHVWHFSHLAFESTQDAQHGVQVGTQEVARGPASLQPGC